MGGIVAPAADHSQLNSYNEEVLMEDIYDTGAQDYMSKWREKKTRAEAREEWESDGTLPKGASDEMLELREFLEDTNLLRPLGLFAKGGKCIEVLMCWVDIQGFKSIHEDAVDYQRSSALHIYHKYVKLGACAEVKNKEGLNVMDDEWRENVSDILDDVKDEITDLPVRLFDGLQQRCFYIIYYEIFSKFKRTSAYEAVMTDLKTNYNKVVADDFIYMEKLGQGTFGIVVHCKKISTGKHYAMKIQTKVGLLNCYHDALHRVDNERQVLTACHHPFIISMEYAFQTRTLICMAMDLGTGGTLLDALSSCEGNCMSEDRVRFYTAEIVLALAHLHRMGLIYRDLKPQNILLCEDGHIKLVDMGGVVDVSGRVLKNYNDVPEELLVLFSPDEAPPVEPSTANRVPGSTDHSAGGDQFCVGGLSNKQQREGAVAATSSPVPEGKSADHSSNHVDESGSSGNHLSMARNHDSAGFSGGPNGSINKPGPKLGNMNRAKSVMGTHGYMAPEVLVLLKQRSAEKKGYTNAVDWWSLGVTMYKLLTGHIPFPNMNVSQLINWSTEQRTAAHDVHRDIIDNAGKNIRRSVYDSFNQQYIDYCKNLLSLKTDKGISSSCLDMIVGFLEVVEEKRLGFGPFGSKNVKKHPFLKNSQWELLEQKHIIAPYRPISTTVKQSAMYRRLDDVLISNGKQNWLSEFPTRNEQKYFQNWNYISPMTMSVEMGFEKIMEQYDGEFKVKQLLLTSKSQAQSPHDTAAISYHRRPSGGGLVSNVISSLVGGAPRRSSNPNVGSSRRPSNVSTTSLTNLSTGNGARRGSNASSSSNCPPGSPAGIVSPTSRRGSSSSASSFAAGLMSPLNPLSSVRRGSATSTGSAQAALSPLSPAASARRGSSVSVYSDCSSVTGVAAHAPSSSETPLANSPNTNAANSKRKGSNFEKHVQLMHELMHNE